MKQKEQTRTSGSVLTEQNNCHCYDKKSMKGQTNITNVKPMVVNFKCKISTALYTVLE